jgi:uncharacterized protein YjiS (DUF1127 family)
MNATVGKDQLTDFSLGNVSYIGPSYEEPQTRSRTVDATGGVRRGWLSRLMAAVGAWRQRQVVLQEMQTMSDRELADIGLSRADLVRVFDPAFTADYARGRDYIAY